MIRRPPRSPLFPYPTLFRSEPERLAARFDGGVVLDGHGVGAFFRPARVHDLASQRRHDRRAVGVVELDARSEEHTSELQSPCNLVCRLLLEKTKAVTCTLTL